MPTPQFIQEKPLSLSDVKSLVEELEGRDKELNFLTNKVKEYVVNFVDLSPAKKEELHKKLSGLGLTRIKEEHLTKIIDFLPQSANDLKVVLQAYPLSLPKKDQDSIVSTIAEFLK